MTQALDQASTISAGDDQVIPFHIEELDLRGRAVQLGPMLNKILEGHNYPAPVCDLLAQVICLGVLLGSSLKFEGRFTIQTQTDGPVSLLVVDYKTPDAVRAYARFDEVEVARIEAEGEWEAPVLLGNGAMAMTIDQGTNSQRYQGIVALDGSTLEDVAHQYFKQSEQIPTKVRLATARLIEASDDGKSRTSWRAGGLLAQFLPQASHRMKMPDLPDGREDSTAKSLTETDQFDDAWTQAQSLVSTIADDELSDPQINSEKLLYRLFHQYGVQVYPATKVEAKCGCSRQKILSVINSFSPDEQKEAFEGSDKPGFILSKCEFCGSSYEFSDSDLRDSQ